MADKKKTGYLLDVKTLRRRYPESGLASTICLGAEQELRLPSRNLAINYHLGGGIKYGSIIEVSGEESTGKSLLAMDFGTVTQSLGGIVLWDDAEATFDGKWAASHGLDLNKVELLPYENQIELVSDWVADMCVYYRSKLTNNEPILLVIDSVALFDTGDALDTAEMDSKAEMGRRSFHMGKFLRKRMRIFAKYGICVLLINQLRKKVGASKFEDPNTTPLEQALKFYASQRIGLFRGKKIRKGGKSKGPWVGNEVYVRTKKNKSGVPRDNIKAEVYFREDNNNYGYHKYYGFDELLVDKNIVKRKMGKFYYKETLIAKGDDNFKQLIATDQELRSKFIKRLGINTASKTRKQIESIDKNLFPVKAKKQKQPEDGSDIE